MKKFVFVLVLGAGLYGVATAQEAPKKNALADYESSSSKQIKLSDRKEGWYYKGAHTLLFNQTAFSNWISGGVNTAAFTARIDYDWDYTQGKHLLDNHMILGYGIRAEKSKTTKKVEDVIDLNSVYGYRFKESWYYASRLNFRTQFWKGYDYDKKPPRKISNFLSPGYLLVGFGVDYRPDDRLTVNLHPLTSRMTFVTDKDVFKTYNGNGNPIGKAKAYGIDPDGSFRYELGAYLGARYKMQLMENVSLDNRLGVFSNYLDKPQNMLMSYSGALDMKINKILSAQLWLDMVYDDNQIQEDTAQRDFGDRAYLYSREAIGIDFARVNTLY